MRRLSVHSLALTAFGILLFGSRWSPLHADATTSIREVAPGVTYTQEVTSGTEAMIVHVLRIDRRVKGVRIKAGQALDVVSYGGTAQGRETMSRMAARTGAIAAINGDFFPFNGDPTSLEIRDGELISEPIGYRVAIGLTRDAALMQILTSRGTVRTADRTEIRLNGINHLPHEGETVVLTSTYAAVVTLKQAATVVTLTGAPLPFHVSRDLTGNIDTITSLPADRPLPPCPKDGIQIVAAGVASALLAAHCSVGDNLSVRYDLLPVAPKAGDGLPDQNLSKPTWQAVEQAIGGGPWLVRDGKTFVDGKDEHQSLANFVNARHPRTAIGICGDGALLLVVVDGRKAISRGATLSEMAEIMKRCGAQQAINLDGGGSTDMVVAGGVVNIPSDGQERPVANGLLVFADAPKARESHRLHVQSDQSPALMVQAGETMSLVAADTRGKSVTTPILWGTQNGLGFVDAEGVFHGFTVGTGTVFARIGKERVAATVTVTPGAPTGLKATFSPLTPDSPNGHRVTLTVTDTYGNAVPNVIPILSAEGGLLEDMPAATRAPTDAKGRIFFSVRWTAGAPKRSIRAILSGRTGVEFIPPTGKTEPHVKELIDPDNRPPLSQSLNTQRS